MTKPLKRTSWTALYHYMDGERIDGPNPSMTGDCTLLRGDCTHLRGYCTHLRGDCTHLLGDCSGLWGDCSGLWGDCTGLWGDLDEIPMDAGPCGLSDWTED